MGVELDILTDDPELRRKAKSYAAFVCEDIVAGLICFKNKELDCIRENRSTKELNHTRHIVCCWTWKE